MSYKKGSKKTSKKDSKKTSKKISKKTSKKDSKYENRKSPPVSAQDYPDKIKKGNDGKEYRSEKDKNGIYRWKLYSTLDKYINDPNIRLFSHKTKIKYPAKEHHMIHDNGGRPFYVEILPEEIKIFKAILIEYDDNDEYPLIRIFKFFKSIKDYERVFIGKSPKNEMTEYSGGFGKGFDGNTILINLKDNMYMFIGGEIYTFKTSEEIVKYVSSVGNNDVPYPCAYTKNYVYLMTEYIYYPKKLAQGEDEYGVYFGHVKDVNLDKKQVHEIANKKIIHKRHMDY